jgi:hypothetical protein
MVTTTGWTPSTPTARSASSQARDRLSPRRHTLCCKAGHPAPAHARRSGYIAGTCACTSSPSPTNSTPCQISSTPAPQARNCSTRPGHRPDWRRRANADPSSAPASLSAPSPTAPRRCPGRVTARASPVTARRSMRRRSGRRSPSRSSARRTRAPDGGRVARPAGGWRAGAAGGATHRAARAAGGFPVKVPGDFHLVSPPQTLSASSTLGTATGRPLLPR